MIKLVYCKQTGCKRIREGRKNIGEISGSGHSYLAFSLIPGRKYDLLVARGVSMEKALEAFLKWRDEPPEPE